MLLSLGFWDQDPSDPPHFRVDNSRMLTFLQEVLYHIKLIKLLFAEGVFWQQESV